MKCDPSDQLGGHLVGLIESCGGRPAGLTGIELGYIHPDQLKALAQLLGQGRGQAEYLVSLSPFQSRKRTASTALRDPMSISMET